MTNPTRPFRKLAVIVTVLFGLGWGVPVVHAACTGTASPEHCSTSAPTQHCDVDEDASSAVCLSHHANLEARAAEGPSVDPSLGHGALKSRRTAVPVRTTTTSPLSPPRPVSHARRRHARIGVWLE